MTIADFFQSENTPDWVVEWTLYMQVLQKAKYIGNEFRIPSATLNVWYPFQKVNTNVFEANFLLTTFSLCMHGARI